MQYINLNFMIMVPKEFYSMAYQEFNQQHLSYQNRSDVVIFFL